jgi:zinc transporter ZupT
MMVSGIIIGFSSCAAFLGGTNFGGGSAGNQGLQGLFAIGFLAGLGIALLGFVSMIIGFARLAVNAMRSEPSSPSFSPQTARVPGVTSATPATRESAEERILRQFQTVLVIFMLLPATSIATSVLLLMTRPRMLPSVILIVISYILSQAPYGFALVRTRRGPDRLGIAVAFAASCTIAVEGLLPLLHPAGMFANRLALSGWPALFLIAHVVVAVFAWRAGTLSAPESGDAALIAGCFVGVAAYLIAVRFLETSLLPVFVRGIRGY